MSLDPVSSATKFTKTCFGFQKTLTFYDLYVSVLKFPNSLNWTLATRLSECFSGVNMDVSGQHSLFRIDIIREATIASKSLPDIPKAFATLLIAMVSQKYLTINDLESHALALLHFEWAKVSWFLP